MKIQELVSKLEIEGGETKGSSFVYTMADSDEYAAMYSKLDEMEELQEDLDAQDVNLFGTKFKYETDGLEVDLNADFEKDIYRLTIREV